MFRSDYNNTAARSFIFIEKGSTSGEDVGDVSGPINSTGEGVKSRLKAREDSEEYHGAADGDEWQVRLEPDKSRVSGVVSSGWYIVSNHQKEVAKRSAMMTLNRSNSRFTSYVDLNSADDPGEMELKMKPSLLEGEMMITQADKVCLYSSQFGG